MDPSRADLMLMGLPLSSADGSSSKPLRVLLAEPDLIARQRFVEALRPLGCDAIEASDGREALIEALVRRPSLIVMEARLPLVSGPALCEILRRDSLTRSVPIVAIATDTRTGDADRIRRAGADSILLKPVDVEALVSEARRLTSDPPPARADAAIASEPIAPEPSPPRRRQTKSRMHVRCTTTTPPSRPPVLRCPCCDGALVYERSHLGGVSQRQPEQWDDFVCLVCGTFEYRHRTRKLRERRAQR
jgi:two-component system, cell cycle response regulator DivK